MRRRRLLPFLIVACVLNVCGDCGSTPGTGGTGPEQPIDGTERFGWDQAASDVSELSTFRFALYLDGVREQAPEVTCGTIPSGAGFPCTCQLPTIPAGAHTLQVAAYVNDEGTIRESDRSAPLRVVKR